MRKLLIALALVLLPTALYAGESKAPEGAKVYFINLKDGDTVTSPFKM